VPTSAHELRNSGLTTGFFGGEPVPAPARELTGWQEEAVEQMAAHLVELGFKVLDQRPAVTETPHDWNDPFLGALRVRRYGWETTGVVRVDEAGEVFIRLDPDAAPAPLFQLVPDEEDW
jgi:hypothetical protein